jgi:hypothetical protein
MKPSTTMISTTIATTMIAVVTPAAARTMKSSFAPAKQPDGRIASILYPGGVDPDPSVLASGGFSRTGVGALSIDQDLGVLVGPREQSSGACE